MGNILFMAEKNDFEGLISKSALQEASLQLQVLFAPISTTGRFCAVLPHLKQVSVALTPAQRLV